ncbi:MAG: cytochrome c [Fibrobacterota bacterium]|nr:cytochrome c [Fibrobacterota bacterium]
MKSFFPPGSASFWGRGLAVLFTTACVLQLWTACGKKDPNADPKAVAGRTVYLSYCISCHNVNPKLDGSMGPAVKGSSLDLLTARVIHGTYPAGYMPKRPSKIMVSLPLTEANIEDLHVYLNAP